MEGHNKKVTEDRRGREKRKKEGRKSEAKTTTTANREW